MAGEGLRLDIWGGDWGLPSIDHQCLSVMAYCKFSDVPIDFKSCNNPWKSPNGELPVLRFEEGAESKVTNIFNFLRKQNWGTDHELTSKQSADLLAFISYMDEKLLPALLHLWWVDARNYVEFTRPWYSRALPFPLSMYMPLKRHKEYVNRLTLTHGTENTSDIDREAKIYKDAKDCLNMLASQLGDKEYFFGKTPTSLDAVVFGYLAPLLKAPFPNTTLQNHLKACGNLCQMCSRVLDKHFPLSPQEKADLEKKNQEKKSEQATATEFPNRRRNIILSGFVAVTAMLGYAFLSGLIQIEVSDAKNKSHISPHKPHAPLPPNFGQFDKLFDEEKSKRNEQESEE